MEYEFPFKQLGAEIAFSLCRFLSQCISERRDDSSISTAYSCLMAWVLIEPWILDYPECLVAVIETIGIGLEQPRKDTESATLDRAASGGKPRTSRKDKKVRNLIVTASPMSGQPNPISEVAELALVQLLNLCGNFPTPLGPASTSSLWNERIQMPLLDADLSQSSFWSHFNARQLMRYFLVDNRCIVGIVEEVIRGQSDTLPAGILVFRDLSGKYSWMSQFAFSSPEPFSRPKNTVDSESITSSAASHVSGTAPARGAAAATVRQFSDDNAVDSIRHLPTFNSENLPALKSIVRDPAEFQTADKLMKLQFGTESRFLEDLNDNAAPQPCCHEFTGSEIDPNISYGRFVHRPCCCVGLIVVRLQVARLFLSHFGLLNHDLSRHHVVQLPLEDALLSHLKDLDDIPTFVCC